MFDMFYYAGVGGVGKRILKHLIPSGIIKGIFDNDVRKQGQSLYGLIVEPYDSVVAKEYGVIIGFFDSIQFELKLKQDGIRYWTLGNFVTEWYRKNQNLIAIAFLDIPVTSRCTLNCKHCMQYIPYRIGKSDIPISDMKRSLERLYNTVDLVLEVSIIGGEPFLYPDLADLLYSINRNKIKSVVITTNGMVLPDENVLKACMETDTFISISDYSHTLPYLTDRIDEFEKRLKKASVKCERKIQSWVAPGRFEGNNDHLTDRCTRTHFQLSNNQLWYCSMQCGANLSGICNGKKGQDFIQLDGIDNIKKTDVQHVVSEHKTSVCSRCENIKGHIVPVAEQFNER